MLYCGVLSRSGFLTSDKALPLAEMPIPPARLNHGESRAHCTIFSFLVCFMVGCQSRRAFDGQIWREVTEPPEPPYLN